MSPSSEPVLNGLAAALVMARAGLDVHVYEAGATIGGGTRTTELHRARASP